MKGVLRRGVGSFFFFFFFGCYFWWKGAGAGGMKSREKGAGEEWS